MWLGYDKPLPERPPITPQKKKKHIKRRTSLILLGLFFFFDCWCANADPLVSQFSLGGGEDNTTGLPGFLFNFYYGVFFLRREFTWI
ncbi:hypothetical protein [Marinomonas shanghaiensis]|uniref:hypothetical protein n=1 Tax=Marinomonas shanghaiensis TaxID=2202418 RepID=UPI003A8F6EC0